MKTKILMIDDDEDMCEEMSEILGDEGYAVDAICDGIEGNKRMENNAYDLILLDMKMPKISGDEILKNAKEKRIKAKIIVLTGSLIMHKSSDHLPESALGIADAVLTKPFSVEEVLSKIKELIKTT